MAENTSKLPHIQWPTDEAEQLAALQNSEQLAAFAAYRKQLRQYPHTTYFHFCAPDGKINDPNGLCFWNGRYHLFYQAYPPIDPRQHWGHAISEDLVHWTDLPTAIYPDPEIAVYSGNVLIEQDRALAMYFGLGRGVFVAESSDPLLLNWTKLTGDAVIIPNESAPYRVYDPCLRKEPDGYYALTGVTEDTPYGPRMTEQQFYSGDLKKWVWVGKLLDENPFLPVGEDGACPYFLPLSDERYLLFHFSHESGPHILSGRYDRASHSFHPEHHVPLSMEAPGCGTIHAPCAYPDGAGGAYLLFNATEGRFASGDFPRDGLFTMVYHVRTDASGVPLIEPLPAYDSLHDELLYDGDFAAENAKTIPLPAHGKALDISLSVDLQNAGGFRLEVFRSEREHTDITVSDRHGTWRDRSYVTIDTSRSSLDPHCIPMAPESLRFGGSADGKVELRVLLDHCTVEVFCNGTLAFRTAYPTLPESDGLSFTALGGDVTVRSARVWSMNRIY